MWAAFTSATLLVYSDGYQTRNFEHGKVSATNQTTVAGAESLSCMIRA